MFTTSEIAPSPQLAPFVRCYAYCEFNTNGSNITMPWFASHHTNITFFFKDFSISLTDSTGMILKKVKGCYVVGTSTHYNGDITFNGKYEFLQIILQPHGFYTLFNSSPLAIANRIVWSEDVFNSDIKLLHEKLFEARFVEDKAKLVNDWLLQYLNKTRSLDYKNRITAAANLITKNKGLLDIEKLADYTCMSMRNFERIFISETGMTPKQLSCISRFTNALELKIHYPSMKWVSIANQSGYFDQMHLIKDFKRFSGATPSSLLKHVPLLKANYVSHISDQ